MILCQNDSTCGRGLLQSLFETAEHDLKSKCVNSQMKLVLTHFLCICSATLHQFDWGAAYTSPKPSAGPSQSGTLFSCLSWVAFLGPNLSSWINCQPKCLSYSSGLSLPPAPDDRYKQVPSLDRYPIWCLTRRVVLLDQRAEQQTHAAQALPFPSAVGLI